MRYLQRIQDERDLRLFAAGNQSTNVATSLVVQEVSERVAGLNNKIMQQQAITIEEINRLQILLDRLRREKEVLLRNAHQLPDGRHVFKDKHGRVFTEDGEQVARDIVDPNAIGNDKTSWEKMTDHNRRFHDAQNRLDQAFTYQRKLDAFQNKLGDKNLSSEAIGKIERDLELAKPDFIRTREVTQQAQDTTPNAKANFTQAVSTPGIDLDNLKVDSPTLQQ